jgi:predicted PurR-regulated permease PerM
VADSNGSVDPAPEPPPTPESEQGALATPLGTSASTPSGPGDERTTAFYISAWAVARYAMVVSLVVGSFYFLWRIQEVLLLMLLAILFATSIEPLVNRLRRGPFSRGQGILLVYTILFALVAAVIFFYVPGLVEQIGRFVETLPERIAALRPLIEQIGFRPLRELLLRGIGEAQPAVERTLEQPVTPTAPEVLVEAGGALAHTLFSIVTIFLLAYYWLTERAAIKRAVLRVAPASRSQQINAIWLAVEAKLGGWVRGQLLIMLAIGLMAGFAFVALDLPNPLVLAVLAGLCEIVPIIGPFLAFLPAFLVALTIVPLKALILIPVVVVLQQIEGNVLIPRVMSHTVGISPLTVILGILIGSVLYGLAGAFLAVPVAAAIQVILNEILRPPVEEEPDHGQAPQAALDSERRGAAMPAPKKAHTF